MSVLVFSLHPMTRCPWDTRVPGRPLLAAGPLPEHAGWTDSMPGCVSQTVRIGRNKIPSGLIACDSPEFHRVSLSFEALTRLSETHGEPAASAPPSAGPPGAWGRRAGSVSTRPLPFRAAVSRLARAGRQGPHRPLVPWRAGILTASLPCGGGCSVAWPCCRPAPPPGGLVI